jgi:hypothetical protein
MQAQIRVCLLDMPGIAQMAPPRQTYRPGRTERARN